jgi:hypothetical protein
MWGLLLAHYAIRALICEGADEAGYDSGRLSFIHGLRVVRRQVTDQAAIPPEHLTEARREAIAEIVPRPNRNTATAPAPALKRPRYGSYRVKRPTDKIIHHCGPPTPLLAWPSGQVNVIGSSPCQAST